MKKRILDYIKKWECRCYFDGIPDEVPSEINHLVPSYKKIAIAILKNEVSLKSLGFTAPYSEAYNSIKRDEIRLRNTGKCDVQLNLFL